MYDHRCVHRLNLASRILLRSHILLDSACPCQHLTFTSAYNLGRPHSRRQSEHQTTNLSSPATRPTRGQHSDWVIGCKQFLLLIANLQTPLLFVIVLWSSRFLGATLFAESVLTSSSTDAIRPIALPTTLGEFYFFFDTVIVFWCCLSLPLNWRVPTAELGDHVTS